MPEDKSTEVKAHATEHQWPPPSEPLQLDLPEVKALQVKVEKLEQVVESLKREMVKMQVRQMFIKAIIGWRDGEKAPLSKNKLKDLRRLAAELGIEV